ncbi:unnamed protein product [Vitrella brassicaformis CCMP3155]|uniref:CCHC-type domain-containing protein n=3 Tax=Vitrella brassicaformis TaxID=1169539 RepID=A0A0G4G1V4_VITBC|nr:unnamed protein product [Vitrella brassicaformis CCMP3155]|eukprot:CEM21940.1 unnamed protein product [Vitrella brassicaformis CCMP3155]
MSSQLRFKFRNEKRFKAIKVDLPAYVSELKHKIAQLLKVDLHAFELTLSDPSTNAVLDDQHSVTPAANGVATVLISRAPRTEATAPSQPAAPPTLPVATSAGQPADSDKAAASAADQPQAQSQVQPQPPQEGKGEEDNSKDEGGEYMSPSHKEEDERLNAVIKQTQEQQRGSWTAITNFHQYQRNENLKWVRGAAAHRDHHAPAPASQPSSVPGRPGGGRGGGGPLPAFRHSGQSAPPPNYICHKCGKPGHYIQDCPSKGDKDSFGNKHQRRIRPAAGIPRSLLQSVDKDEVDKTDQQNLLVLPDGSFAVMKAVDKTKTAQVLGKSIEQRFTEQLGGGGGEVQQSYGCPLCGRLLREAVIVGCCGTSYCHACVHQHLYAGGKTCPACEQPLTHADVMENFALREQIKSLVSKQSAPADGVAGAAAAGGGVKEEGERKGVVKKEEVGGVRVKSEPPDETRSQQPAPPPPPPQQPQQSAAMPRAPSPSPSPVQDSLIPPPPPDVRGPSSDRLAPPSEQQPHPSRSSSRSRSQPVQPPPPPPPHPSSYHKAPSPHHTQPNGVRFHPYMPSPQQQHQANGHVSSSSGSGPPMHQPMHHHAAPPPPFEVPMYPNGQPLSRQDFAAYQQEMIELMRAQHERKRRKKKKRRRREKRDKERQKRKEESGDAGGEGDAEGGGGGEDEQSKAAAESSSESESSSSDSDSSADEQKAAGGATKMAILPPPPYIPPSAYHDVPYPPPGPPGPPPLPYPPYDNRRRY